MKRKVYWNTEKLNKNFFFFLWWPLWMIKDLGKLFSFVPFLKKNDQTFESSRKKIQNNGQDPIIGFKNFFLTSYIFTCMMCWKLGS